MGLRHGRVDPDGMAIVETHGNTTWSCFWGRVERLGALIAESVSPEGRVAVAGGNEGWTLIAHAAALLAGRSAVAVNPRQQPDEMTHILADAAVELGLVGPQAAVAFREAAGVGVPVLGWDDEPGFLAVLDSTRPEVRLDAPPRQPLLYTSGTSGRPKGTEVRWVNDPGPTVATLLERLIASIAHVPPGPHAVAGPLYHNGPLLALRAALAGNTVLLQQRFDPEGFLGLVAAHDAASTVVVPTHLRRLLDLDAATRARYDVSSLGKVILTGAACPPDLKRTAIAWLGPVVDEAYGGTESGTVCSIGAREWQEHPGSVGRTAAGFEAVVVDDDERPLPPGVIGRLYFRDLSGRGLRYHGDPDKTAAAHLGPGVFTLGDLGYVDDDGYVYLTGRSADTVISGGVNLYPAEAERVLADQPEVADVAVIGVPDEQMGETLLALVVVQDGERFDAEALDAYCRTQLASVKCPRHYEQRTSLPRNPMGKVLRAELRRAYWPADQTIGG